MLPKGYKTVIDWFQEVAAEPNYANPELHRFDDDDSDADTEEQEAGINLSPVEELE